MKTAAAYIRVSTEDQLEYSPSAQLREVKKRAAADDTILLQEYIFIDEGISGRSAKKRSEFNRMISIAKANPKPFDLIYVWKFSRFARNQEESIVYKNMLRKEGVEVVSVSEPLIDGPFGELVERIIEWMDEYYSINLSGEVTRGMTEKALRGEIQTSTPFGFQKDGAKWVINSREADIVSYIFDAYNQNYSFEKISKEANLMGARTKQGNPFYAQRIKYILANPAYVGILRWNGIEHKGKIPRIINDDVWAKTQEKLSLAATDWNKYAKPADIKQHFLSGTLRCADCGGNMVYNSANGGFQCYGYKTNKCFSHFVKGPKIEHILVSALESLVCSEKYIRNVKTLSVSNDSEKIKAEISRCEHMLNKAKLAYLEDVDTLEEYTDNKTRITEQIDALKRSLQGTASSESDKQKLIQKISDLIELINDERSEMHEKHDAIRGFIRRIDFKKPEEEVIIYFYL